MSISYMLACYYAPALIIWVVAQELIVFVPRPVNNYSFKIKSMNS